MWVKICNKAVVNSLRCYEWCTGLFIHKYATAPSQWPTIPSAYLRLYLLPPAAATLHSAPLPINPVLSYLSTLHYPPHPFHNPRSYTQSLISPSALFCVLATPLLQTPRKCQHLCTAVKLKKRGLLPIVSFLYLKTYTTGLIILCIGSLRPASLPGPIIMLIVVINY